MSGTEQPTEECVVIAGVGLIGGSAALAIRQVAPQARIIGIGRNAERMQRAVDTGLLDQWYGRVDASEIPAGSLGLVCLPVDRVAECSRQLLQAGCDVVTDAGSVKAAICSALSDLPGFVGAHPIAGSEQSGFEYADGGLFAGRICVICREDVEHPAVQRTLRFWHLLRMDCHIMPAVRHDHVLARTSHLPHILASVAAGCVTDEELMFAGSGFRDTTRIAAGGDALWSSILLENSSACISAVDAAMQRLSEYRSALVGHEEETLRSLWADAANRRRRLHDPEIQSSM